MLSATGLCCRRFQTDPLPGRRVEDDGGPISSEFGLAERETTLGGFSGGAEIPRDVL